MPLPPIAEHVICNKNLKQIYRCNCGADQANTYRNGYIDGWLAATGEFPEGYDDAGN